MLDPDLKNFDYFEISSEKYLANVYKILMTLPSIYLLNKFGFIHAIMDKVENLVNDLKRFYYCNKLTEAKFDELFEKLNSQIK